MQPQPNHDTSYNTMQNAFFHVDLWIYRQNNQVLRRGRWISSRVMDIYIYLEEVSVTTFAERLAPQAFRRITHLYQAFLRF